MLSGIYKYIYFLFQGLKAKSFKFSCISSCLLICCSVAASSSLYILLPNCVLASLCIPSPSHEMQGRRQIKQAIILVTFHQHKLYVLCRKSTLGSARLLCKPREEVQLRESYNYSRKMLWGVPQWHWQCVCKQEQTWDRLLGCVKLQWEIASVDDEGAPTCVDLCGWLMLATNLKHT